MTTPWRLLLALILVGPAISPALATDSDESWTERLSFYGSLHLRHEDIEDDGNPDANQDRERGSARVTMDAAVSDDVTITIGIATGGDNPVSRNVTGDGGFTSKEIGFELMFAEWRPGDNVEVYAGKMRNPLFRAGSVPLIWDGDLNPEGAAVAYRGERFFATIGGFSVEERSGADDSYLYAVQAGADLGIGRDMSLKAGAGYFAYTNTAGNTPFYDGNPNGNTVDAAGDYVFDYRNIEVFAEFGAKAGSWPLSIYATYTVNTEVDRQDTAWALGARLGSSERRGDLKFTWTYQDLEADSLIGTFSDSNFGGGGTDSDGHVLKAKYMLADNVAIEGNLYLNEIGRFQGTPHDFQRVQLDLEFEFE